MIKLDSVDQLFESEDVRKPLNIHEAQILYSRINSVSNKEHQDVVLRNKQKKNTKKPKLEDADSLVRCFSSCKHYIISLGRLIIAINLQSAKKRRTQKKHSIVRTRQKPFSVCLAM